MILMMIAEVLFFDIFFEKDSHLNAVEGEGRGHEKKLLRNRGLVSEHPLLGRGSFQIASSVFLQISIFSLLLEYVFFFYLVNIHVTNRSILSCGLLSIKNDIL